MGCVSTPEDAAAARLDDPWTSWVDGDIIVI
jgi:hypothetical protein